MQQKIIRSVLCITFFLTLLLGCDVYSPTINNSGIEQELTRYTWVIYEENNNQYHLRFYSNGWGYEEYTTATGWERNDFDWYWIENGAYNTIIADFYDGIMELQSISINFNRMTCYIDGRLHSFAGI